MHQGAEKWFRLPGRRIPKWFDHISRQDSISFWCRNKLPEIYLCVVAGQMFDGGYWEQQATQLIINGKYSLPCDYSQGRLQRPDKDHIIIADTTWTKFANKVDEMLMEDGWNHVECRFRSMRPWKSIVKKLGICVHKHKSTSMRDIRFTDPLLLKDVLNMGDFQRNMQREKNLASLTLLETRQGK